MRSYRWLFGSVAILGIVTIAVFYMMNTTTSSRSTKETLRGTALSVWIYSQEWEKAVTEFQQNHPDVDMDVRYFRSGEQLITELLASISANAAPQLAEIHSFYGITELVHTGAPLSVDPALMAEWQLNPVFTSPFRYQNEDWAVPVGGSLPLLFYREELLKDNQSYPFPSWKEVAEAAALSNKEGLNLEPSGHWGMAIDKELPWYLDNLSYTASDNSSEVYERLVAAISSWRDWVHGSAIMKPLVHQRAASDFINGKVGMFVSASDKLRTIERYIGGKFPFNVQRLPVLAQQGIVPEVNGLVVLHTTPEKQNAANTFISYMLDNATQTSLWRDEGMIPARSDVVQQLQEERTWSERQKMILDSVRMLTSRKPTDADYRVWKEARELLEQAELDPSLASDSRIRGIAKDKVNP